MKPRCLGLRSVRHRQCRDRWKWWIERSLFTTLRQRSSLDGYVRWSKVDCLYLGTLPNGIGKLEAPPLTKDPLSLFPLGSLSREITNVKKIRLTGRIGQEPESSTFYECSYLRDHLYFPFPTLSDFSAVNPLNS